jgi:hypothetical protein
MNQRPTHQKSRTTEIVLTACTAVGFTAAALADNWVEFVDETATRLIGDPSVGANDETERDYVWADLNKNGWIDLVVMRKRASNTVNGQITDALFKTNVLYMNEGGVLVDRTAEYASRVALDQLPEGEEDFGFLTPTIDRAAVIVDVNGNGWLDIVTSPSLSHGRPKHISHPRVYINLGNDEHGNWLGFEFQNDRIPQLAGIVPSGPWAGTPHAPRFCGVSAGDVTGNGHADLYFNDYSSTCAGCPSATFNFNDRLLINDGNGYFTDETSQRLPFGFYESNMGVHPIIADFNGNGYNDILKMSTLGGCCPYAAYMIYNNNENGDFLDQDWHIPPGAGGSPYFVQKADLNNNGRLDLIIGDDGTDRFTINRGTFPNGMVNWSPHATLPNSSGFRSNIVAADLNNNGFVDILTASVDFDLYGWNRLSGFHRHNGNTDPVGFTWDSGNIPQSMLYGTYDFAVFDITGNGWNDIVIAWGNNVSSGGTTVWINQPTFGVDFNYPDGRPSIVNPNESTTITVHAQPAGDTIDSMTLFFGPGSDPYTSPIEFQAGSDNTWTADLPELDCGTQYLYYIQANMSGGGIVTDPVNAPDLNHYSLHTATGLQLRFEDDMGPPKPDSGWFVVSDPSLTGGEWEAAVPNPTLFGGDLASPNGDASPDSNGMAFTTENCEPFAPPGSCDVEGGPTYLIRALTELDGTNALITYDRWFFTSGSGDLQRSLRTDISNDGGQTWTFVHQTTGTDGDWQSASFIIADYVEPTDQLMIRFGTSDEGDATVTNAGIDNVVVEELACGESCTGDLNGDGVVNVADLLLLFDSWGSCPGCDADFNGDDIVNVADLLILFDNWGPCN